MSDIVERLRDEAKESETRCRCMCHEAAAEIERLRARVAELEGQHKGLVIQNAILRSRPDLPADRIPAANRVAELEAEVSMLQREVSREARLRHQLHGVLKEHEFFIRTERKADDAARAANGEVRSE